MIPSEPLSALSAVLVALALVIVVSKLLGRLLARFEQPPVIGEILGGIVLGPSLLGALAPQLQEAVFSQAVLPQLNLLSQLGLILFMFLVGLEVNPEHLRGRARLAVRISLAGITLPLVLGVLLAFGLEAVLPELLPGDRTLPGMLFMGTAMAITAFPVLSRLLKDRGLMGQPLGQLVISCAAIDDVVSWVLLAAVVSFTRSGSGFGALPALVGTLAWALILLVGLRPLMGRLEAHYREARQLSPFLLSLLFAGAILSAVITDWIGVHYIFGAFLFGLALPRYGPLLRRLQLHTEDLVLTVLLPVFFAMSGLNTRIGSLDRPLLWLALVAVLAVAIGGKFLGCWAMARQGGLPPAEAQAVGWLMNTRGLTELVILNVALSLGVISTTLFTMMVVMALVTTAMASPLLTRLGISPAASPG
ncbi:cation:proton antiporter [Synechococcus sp. Tobar12-5m-g]|uniref:cation:proton antiporter domain-containing protein n=1 Tax=unclassified Synechococcus TaxID=2626047 RepID=UPI0020CDBD5E|nr:MULTISPECIES: cation:proton antiporter [unclassified Synechococcus]MCP9773484.1 cation:proton antiporter [Synechococcus sp. Tobar12-5m-g]MCP9874458.1 cation:proton antiporter [Synechococcus sp. Cruz CV-v-12]